MTHGVEPRASATEVTWGTQVCPLPSEVGKGVGTIWGEGLTITTTTTTTTIVEEEEEE